MLTLTLPSAPGGSEGIGGAGHGVGRGLLAARHQALVDGPLQERRQGRRRRRVRRAGRPGRPASGRSVQSSGSVPTHASQPSSIAWIWAGRQVGERVGHRVGDDRRLGRRRGRVGRRGSPVGSRSGLSVGSGVGLEVGSAVGPPVGPRRSGRTWDRCVGLGGRAGRDRVADRTRVDGRVRVRRGAASSASRRAVAAGAWCGRCGNAGPMRRWWSDVVSTVVKTLVSAQRVRHRHHPRDVRLAVVVAQQGGPAPALRREVAVAGAQVDGGAEGGVVDVLDVAGAVVVTVDRDRGPGRRQELHRPDRTVEAAVAVEPAGVGVAHHGGAVPAVEPRAR